MKIPFVMLALLSGSIATAQTTPSYNRLALEAQLGLNNPVNPMAPTYDAVTLGPLHTGVAARWMFNAKAGVKLGVGYDLFRASNASSPFTTDYIRVSAEGVANLGNLFSFSEWTDRVGLLVHGGFGYSTMKGRGSANGWDQMLHAMAGITPQVRLNDRFALSLDLSVLAHVYQSHTYDFTSRNLNPGVDGYLYNLSVGVQYSFGTQQRYADWAVADNHSKEDAIKEELSKKMEEDRNRIAQLEQQLKDDDGDGVSNYFDLEPATAEGALVNTHGVTLPPVQVAEPAVKGTVTSEPTEIDGFTEFPTMKGLFFTVQIGCYKEAANPEKRYGLSPLMKATTIDGETRYLYGVFGQLNNAETERTIAMKKGVDDAFVTAYYQGKRITIAHAENLLAQYGSTILEPAH